MEPMQRKQIYLRPSQDRQLKRMVRETGLSEAELIRQAIDAQTQSGQLVALLPEAWQDEKKFIQELMAKGPSEGGRRWRREDLYER